MTDYEQEVRDVADALRSRAQDRDAIARVAVLVAHGAGRDLTRALVKRLDDASDEADAVQKTMWLLESMAEVDACTAVYLMTRLCRMARDLFMRNVVDAIELWVASVSDPALVTLLKADVAKDDDLDMQARYKDWIRLIEHPTSRGHRLG